MLASQQERFIFTPFFQNSLLGCKPNRRMQSFLLHWQVFYILGKRPHLLVHSVRIRVAVCTEVYAQTCGRSSGSGSAPIFSDQHFCVQKSTTRTFSDFSTNHHSERRIHDVSEDMLGSAWLACLHAVFVRQKMWSVSRVQTQPLGANQLNTGTFQSRQVFSAPADQQRPTQLPAKTGS